MFEGQPMNLPAFFTTQPEIPAQFRQVGKILVRQEIVVPDLSAFGYRLSRFSDAIERFEQEQCEPAYTYGVTGYTDDENMRIETIDPITYHPTGRIVAIVDNSEGPTKLTISLNIPGVA